MTGVQCLHIETFKIHTIMLRYKVYETEWLVTWVYKMQTNECASRFYTFWRTSHLDSHLRRFLGLDFSKNLSWLWSPLQLATDSQIGRHEHLLSTGETSVQQVLQPTGFQHRDSVFISLYTSFAKEQKSQLYSLALKCILVAFLTF